MPREAALPAVLIGAVFAAFVPVARPAVCGGPADDVTEARAAVAVTSGTLHRRWGFVDTAGRLVTAASIAGRSSAAPRASPGSEPARDRCR
jgi:hypothetical protein